MSDLGEGPRKRLRLDSSSARAEEIGQLCYRLYRKLPKSGKPTPAVEHTVLAAVVEEHKTTSKLCVVALATGTKCFPKNLATKAEAIVDCHAESLVKRCFKHHLLGLCELWLDQGNRIDDFREGVLDSRRYHLFISQTPCGCRSRWQGDYNEHRQQDDHFRQFKPAGDGGAGGVNRKPGRGPPCPKPGCIHKLAKWNLFGLQGKELLTLTTTPVYFDSINVGNCEDVIDTFHLSETRDHLTIAKNEDQDQLKALVDNNANNFLDLSRATAVDINFVSTFRHEEFLRATPKKGKKRPAGSSILAWRLPPASGLLIKSSTTGAAAAADDGSDTVASGGGGDEVNDVLCLQSYSILIASHGRRLGATKRSCCCCCQINREDANDGDDDNRKQASKINQRTLTAAADDGGGVRTRPCEYCAGMLTICDRKLRLYLERLLLRTPRDDHSVDDKQARQRYGQLWQEARRHLVMFRGWPE